LLASLVVVLPLARGGVGWFAQVAALAITIVAFVLAASTRQGATPLAAAVLLIPLAAMVAQLIPLPPSALRALSPSAAALFDSTLGPIGLWPAARPLSLDPAETARQVATFVTCLAALAAAARLGSSRRTSDLLLGSIAGSGAIAASLGLGAALVGAGPLLESRITFVNPNHLSAFLDLAALVALGFGLRARGDRRALWLIVFALCGAGVFLTLSRGGIGAFFVGAAVFSALYLRKARLERGADYGRFAAILIAAVSVVIVIAAWLALDPIVSELKTVKGVAGERKLELLPIAVHIVRDFPLFGVGRGAFGLVFPSYKVDAASVTFTHLENEWLQPVVELGLPAGLLLVAALGWIWIRAVRATELSHPEIGALAGAAAVAAHDVFDFSLELLGVAVPFAIVLGLAARSQRAGTPKRWHLNGAAVALGAIAFTGITFWRLHPTDVDAGRVAGATSGDEAKALALKALAWHPADYLPHAAAGALLVHQGRCAEGLPWLTRAMVLNPTAAEPHRYAARCLAAAGQNVLAQREYRLAMLMGDPTVLPEAMRRYQTVDDLLQVVPDQPGALVQLGEAFSTANRPAEAARVFRLAWDTYREPIALAGLARATLTSGEKEEALSLARRLEEEEPTSAHGWVIAAEALNGMKRTAEAKRELALGATRAPGSAAVLVPLAQLALWDRHFAEALRVAQSIVAIDPPSLAAKRAFIARVLLAQGRASEAVIEAAAARDALPREAWTHVRLAEACASAERFDEAIAELELAATMPGSSSVMLSRRLEELRAARDAQRDAGTRRQVIGPAP
jgi:tetratricopeptide (TPR) repeat protein